MCCQSRIFATLFCIVVICGSAINSAFADELTSAEKAAIGKLEQQRIIRPELR